MKTIAHASSQSVSAIQQLEAPDYYTDDPLQRDSVMQNALARLRELLPARESVLFNGQNIDVDNAWFHQALDAYEKLGHQPERATAVVTRTREQLRALLERLDEMKSASSTEGKDASKARLAEILRRSRIRQERGRKKRDRTLVGGIHSLALETFSEGWPNATRHRPSV